LAAGPIEAIAVIFANLSGATKASIIAIFGIGLIQAPRQGIHLQLMSKIAQTATGWSVIV